jgi:hypothetical protein
MSIWFSSLRDPRLRAAVERALADDLDEDEPEETGETPTADNDTARHPDAAGPHCSRHPAGQPGE